MKTLLAEALGPAFEVIKPLSKGKRAEVYLAREIPLDRLVAVKVLLDGLAADDVARARFEREAKAAASVNHPHATSVFRCGFLPNGTPFLVLQYVRGRTLEARIETEGPLSVAEARKVLCGIAGALAAAHEHGFVHRDVSPANVLCDAETGRSILTDFGVAGILPTGKPVARRLTQTGEFLGDIEHRSPEALSGADATEASDVYALGVLGYEILTGGGPYSHLPISGKIAAQMRGTPPSLASLLTEEDPELSDIIGRCLAKAPDRRPTAHFIAEALGSEPGARSLRRSAGDAGLLADLISRRLPQFLVVTAGAGWLALEGVSQLVDMDVLGRVWYEVALATVVCGLVASGVVTWFHGARGKQKIGVIEVAFLATIAVTWLLVSWRIVFSG